MLEPRVRRPRPNVGRSACLFNVPQSLEYFAKLDSENENWVDAICTLVYESRKFGVYGDWCKVSGGNR